MFSKLLMVEVELALVAGGLIIASDALGHSNYFLKP